MTVSVPLALAWIMFMIALGCHSAISPMDDSRKQSPIWPWLMSLTSVSFKEVVARIL